MTMLGDTIDRFKIKPKNIWNMDEKGVQLGVVGKCRVVVDRNQTTIQNIESGVRDLITIITSSTPDRNNCSSTKALAGRRHRRQVAGQGRQ